MLTGAIRFYDFAMRVLIAEDNDNMRKHLQFALEDHGHEVVVTKDGTEAWEELQKSSAPHIAILDWNMPGYDGPEICKKLRALETEQHKYIILLTVRNRSDEIAAGLDAGANDYIVKPFDFEELRARVAVGQRVVELQQSLAKRVDELQAALAHVKRLQGLLPICMHCHKIRNDKQSWQKLEAYIHENSEAKLSHGLCPDCLQKHYPQYANVDLSEFEDEE